MNHLEIGFNQNNKWYNFICVIASVIGIMLLLSFLLGLIFIFFLNDSDYLFHLSFIESLIINPPLKNDFGAMQESGTSFDSWYNKPRNKNKMYEYILKC